MPECFVIMPLTTPPEAAERYGDADHFAHVLEHLFVPAIEAAGFTAKRPVAEGSDLIHAEIVRNLETADMVLCDISALNANVFFEFGIRTALDRPICMVRDEHTKLPFDIGGLNCHSYAAGMNAWELAADIERLTKHLTVACERADGHNALWRHFGLTQRGKDAIDAAPEDAQGSAMKLILDEIQQMRREGTPQGRDLGEAPTLGSGDRPIDAFYRDVRAILEAAGLMYRSFEYGADYVRFRKSASWPPAVKAEVTALGSRDNIRVSFG